MRRLPPLNALRAFEAAARHESVVKAAGELNVSHSAISQQIKNLEVYFGENLFLRNGRGIALTPRAREFLAEVRTCFDRLTNAAEYMKSGRARAKLIVNVTPSFAVRWLIPRVAYFQRCYPGVEVHVQTSVTDDINGLVRGSDLIIRRHHMSRRSTVCERILDDVSVAVMSPELWKSLGARKPSDLTKLPLLHMKSRMPAWSQWFQAAGVEGHAGLSGPVYDHFFLSVEAAINGCGVALCPRILVDADIERGALIEAFGEITLEGPGFYCLYKCDTGSSSVSIAVQWLRNQGRVPPLPAM